jgi:methyl-accepting chemotaxis protein
VRSAIAPTEIVGRHHRLICAPDVVNSAEYATFWERHGRGEFITGRFPGSTGKAGNLAEASYNPVFDPEGGFSRWSSSPPT